VGKPVRVGDRLGHSGLLEVVRDDRRHGRPVVDEPLAHPGTLLALRKPLLQRQEQRPSAIAPVTDVPIPIIQGLLRRPRTRFALNATASAAKPPAPASTALSGTTVTAHAAPLRR
jgi:hypothetical protein